MVHRLRGSLGISRLVVAVSDSPADDALVLACDELGVDVFRGSELDVLSRFQELASAYPDFETIVRLTADCPFIDPAIVDLVINEYHTAGVTYCTNRLPPPFTRTYPIGLDVEVFSRSGLEEANRYALARYEREHVTPYFYSRKGSGRIRVLDLESNLSKMRLTIDTKRDLEVCRLLYRNLPSKDSGLAEIAKTWEGLDISIELHAQKSFHETDARWQ
jgi:spore coat polysaccharide biosynthesis protein SpsF